MRTGIEVQLTYGGPWLPGDLFLAGDGSPVVSIEDEIDTFGPDNVAYIKSDETTDEVLLALARDAGFNVIVG